MASTPSTDASTAPKIELPLRSLIACPEVRRRRGYGVRRASRQAGCGLSLPKQRPCAANRRTARRGPMNPVIVIPARMASTRLPNKPLADIHGRPMIAWMVEIAHAAMAGPVLVAAAEEEIAE